ncbi:hypothetical protein P167DRAFT_227270 [Morchella conica CCBAS932]|uniref:Uncharacterized protein n=1 Tax=Morchella conica CCBAS932 TaxID=1392247 RepID=A0A3N4KKV0_9PEZI|nr:hypothetical protein P167DRAFT_227270 [Morchella conica CCBAS932]
MGTGGLVPDTEDYSFRKCRAHATTMAPLAIRSALATVDAPPRLTYPIHSPFKVGITVQYRLAKPYFYAICTLISIALKLAFTLPFFSNGEVFKLATLQTDR